ncbi:MAG: ATP-binding cassette domain-containing protein [Rhodospirillales bacterium]|nr:ATP-binding cassette domain-containing protein [Rhodospirillales bacterium]
MKPLLEARALSVHFPVRGTSMSGDSRLLRAVDGVDIEIGAGETLGIVGESGCGKTTLGRAILRLLEPTGGSIRFDGMDVTRATGAALAPLRKSVQAVFQDPFGSLNPRMRVSDIIGEPLRNLGWPRPRISARVAEVMEIVGLPPEYASRHPHAFSGGQRQRIGIARALAPSPRLIVCDEAVSALDVSIQAQILNLLKDIQRDFGVAYLFVSHNLAVVRHLSHRVAVMYLGRIVELCDEGRLYTAPLHPYTTALLSAVPEPDPERPNRPVVLEGDLPSPIDPPPGCTFHTRCPVAKPDCRATAPALREIEPGRFVRCHFPGSFRQAEVTS